MTQPTKREQLAAMRVEDFKAHLRTIAGDKAEHIAEPRRPHPLLVRSKKRATPIKRRRHRR